MFDHHLQTTTAASFDAVLVEQLRKTPWLVTSLAIHAVILLLLSQISMVRERPQELMPLHVAEAEVQHFDEIIPEPPEETDEVRNDEPRTPEDPVIEPRDVPDAPDDAAEPWDDPKGDENDRGLELFSSDMGNDAIGLGPGGGSPFGRRGRGSRGGGGGGEDGPGERAAVERGLQWLAVHQSRDGSWDADHFMVNGDPARGPLCDGKGVAMYDVGVTGLAVLAFLGAGYDHRSAHYGENVKIALRWLRSEQDAEGCFGPRGDGHFSYNHAIAALAMAEAYGMTRSALWKVPAQRGVDFVMQMQNPYRAWRYGLRPGDDDTSVTGWMVMALKSGTLSGLAVNETAMKWARSFIESMTDPDSGRTGYRERGKLPVRAEGRLQAFPVEESESLTAVGMLIRIFSGEDPRSSPMLKAGAELCTRKLPVWKPETGRVDMYYWYYATLSLFQMGGAPWSAWNARMKPAIIDSQRKDGNFAGSWDPVGPWGEDGGRVYATAMMTMCLEVYYRYPRVFGTR